MDMLLDHSGEPLDDVVMLDPQDIDIPPQSEAVIARIRSWLNPTQYADDGSEYQKHRSSHLQGTGQWVIDSPIFQEWRESCDQGMLWIRGIPGAGKSVHAAHLIEHLSQDGCPVLYFFFRHTIQANHRPEAAFRDWLAQALPFSPPLQLELKDRVSEPVEKLTISDLSQLLQAAFARISKAYCIVDALDEMKQTALEPFLRVLDNLAHWRPASIKFVITSRPVATVERIVRNIRLLDVRLDKELVEPDIIVYLSQRLAQSCILPESHSAVVEYILAKADGLFLYAKLAMDAISHLEDDIEVREALQSLPTDLTDVYSNLLREHLQRTGIAPELQILVLQCVTHAVRPLRLLEISDFITVTQPQHGKDSGSLKALVRSACGPLLEVLPDETIQVVHHSLTEYLLGIIRPVDDAAAPFVLLESGQTHGRIAMLCLTYLHLGGLAQLKVKTSAYRDEEIEKEIYTPFTNYALTNWHTHIKKAAAFGHDLKAIDDFLHQLLIEGHKDNIKKLFLYANSRGRDDGPSEKPPKAQAAALRLAIALDLQSFVESLLDRHGTDITNYDPDIDYSPLIFAVSKGNCNIVRSLIRHGAHINEYDSHGATPLHTAVGFHCGWKGNAKMAEILLKAGADPEKDIGENQHYRTSDHGNTSACRSAFKSANKELAAAFTPYVKGAQGASRALNWAIGFHSARDSGVIDIILRHPELDLNARHSPDRGDFAMTPLFLACTARDSSLIRRLLAAGADPNVLHIPTDRSGHFPSRDFAETSHPGYNVLHALADHGGDMSPDNVNDEETRECFRIVIAAGANVRQVGPKKITPLHQARDKIAARCLIEAGADVYAENDDGETLIHLLPDGDLLEALSDVFDINTQSSSTKQTLLIRALDQSSIYKWHRGTREQEFAKALTLIELGADVTLVDSKGKSALHYAAEMKDTDLPKLKLLWQKLINAGANANLQDQDGETPLHRLGFTSRRFSVKTEDLEAFLDITHPNMEIKDNRGRTPLFKVIDNWAPLSIKEVTAVLKLLAKVGARFDATDLRGRTLLHAAARHCRGDTEHMQLMIEQGGIDPNSQDLDGNTIWHEAIPAFCRWRVSPNVFRSFTTLGVDLTTTNRYGRSPLHVLCESTQWVEEGGNWEKQDDPTLLEYILRDQHVQVNLEDSQGVVPLHIASTFSPFLVQRLLHAGAEVVKTTTEGLNPFHLAARSRQSNVIGVLITWLQSHGDRDSLVGAVNHKDIQGRTPLYYACASGRVESVQLLIAAGALVDTHSYMGSAWNGCADFEEEQRNADWREWDRQSDRYFKGSSAGGVLISDKLRPKRHPACGEQWSDQIRFPVERIDEIVELIISHGPSSASKFMNEAIKSALERQFDYTAMCLIRSHQALGSTPDFDCLEQVSECVKRREAIPPCNADRRLEYLMRMRNYDAAIKLLLTNPDEHLLDEKHIIRSNLAELVKSGFASLVDAVLTPEVMSKLRDVPKPQQVATQTVFREGDDATSRFGKLLEAACLTQRPNMDVLRVLIEGKGIGVNNEGSDTCSYRAPASRGTALHALANLKRPQWWQLHEALPFLLNKGANTETRDGQGMTPLQLCLGKVGTPYFNKEMARILLEAGADSNAVDDRDRSCLARAVSDREVCEMLLNHGARVTHSALAAAIKLKDLELLQLMLSREDVDPNMRRVGKEVPGRSSANGRSFTLGRQDPNGADELYPIDYLLCDVSRDDKSDMSRRMFDLLLAHGANLGAKYERTTVVHRLVGNLASSANSSYGGDNSFLQLVLNHPSLDLEVRDAEHSTLLLHACRLGKISAINTLLHQGANVRAKDNENRNALHLFLSSYWYLHGSERERADRQLLRKEVLERIISLAPELLTGTDVGGRAPLHCSLQHSPFIPTDVNILLDAGADVNAAITRTKDSPLHLLLGGPFHLHVDECGCMTVTGGRIDLFHRFITLGADINARNGAGETPAFNFFRQGSLEVTLPLSDADEADIKTRKSSDQNWRRQELQKQRGRAVAVEHEHRLWDVFEKSGLDWLAKNQSRETLLHVVAADVDKEYVGRRPVRFRFLMGKVPDVLAEDDKHQTALDVAAALGADDILEIFKKKD